MERAAGDIVLSKRSLVTETPFYPHSCCCHPVIELVVAVQSGGFIAVSYLKLKEGAGESLTNALLAAEKKESEEVPCQSQMPSQSVHN